VFDAVDPRDPSIEYQWLDVGMLDFDEPTKLYLVQKLDKQGRVVDNSGRTVVNGGILSDGTWRTCTSKRFTFLLFLSLFKCF